MTLIIPHKPTITGHSHIPFLWRARCPCGWTALAGSEINARFAAQALVDEEDPFPHDMISPDPTHGREG